MFRLCLFVLLALVVACTARPPTENSAYCAELFDQLDTIERTVLAPQPVSLAFPDLRQQQIARIQQARCLTLEPRLVGLGSSAKPGATSTQCGTRAAAGGGSGWGRHQHGGRCTCTGLLREAGLSRAYRGSPRLGRRVCSRRPRPWRFRRFCSSPCWPGTLDPAPRVSSPSRRMRKRAWTQSRRIA